MGKLLILSLIVGTALTTNFETDSYSLTIRTNSLKNSEGTVIVALYNKEGSIPDQKFKNYYKKESIRILDKKAAVTFNDVPHGLYAVTILHDENKNEKLDTKFMLPLPDEGVGFSNYDDFGLSNRPNFKNASFNLDKD